jgi:Protein of unknown function (DUF2723)
MHAATLYCKMKRFFSYALYHRFLRFSFLRPPYQAAWYGWKRPLLDMPVRLSTVMDMQRENLLKVLVSAPSIAGFCAFFLYAVSSPPGVGLWDTAEYQTVAWIAGIPHPTGFPAFVVSGWLFTHFFPFGNPAWRVTMMSALAVASACAALVILLQRFNVNTAVALSTTALFSVGEIIWTHATYAASEPFVLLFGALAITNAIAWIQDRDHHALIRTGLFAGLALATHPVSLWYLPGLGILAFLGLRQSPKPLHALGSALCAGIAALGLYAYLPIRSAIVTAQHRDPTTALLGMPPGQAIWDTDHPATFEGFVRLVTGADFGAASSLHGIFAFGQYPTFLQRLSDLAITQEGFIPSMLAVLGACVLLRRWTLLIALVAIAFSPIPFSMLYTALIDIPKYYLLTLWVIAFFTGIGANAITQCLSGASASIPALLLAIIAGSTFQAQSPPRFAQHLNHAGEQVIATILSHTEKNAIVGAGWSYVTPLAYAKYVEGRLDERIPLTGMPKKYIAQWLSTRPVYYMPDFELHIPGVALTPIPNTWPTLYRVGLAP